MDRIQSKSVYGFEEKIDLLFCNMNTHKARKAICEKVQVDATVRDRNLWTSQRTMCGKEIYNTSMQDFANFLKIGVNANYHLISGVTIFLQRNSVLVKQVNVSACPSSTYSSMDRVPDFESGGYRFKSYYVDQKKRNKVPKLSTKSYENSLKNFVKMNCEERIRKGRYPLCFFFQKSFCKRI